MCWGGAGRGEAALPARDVVELAGAPPGVGGVGVHRPAARGGASKLDSECCALYHTVHGGHPSHAWSRVSLPKGPKIKKI